MKVNNSLVGYSRVNSPKTITEKQDAISFGSYEIPQSLLFEVDRFSGNSNWKPQIEETKRALGALFKDKQDPLSVVQQALENFTDEHGIHVRFDHLKSSKDDKPELGIFVKCLGEEDDSGLTLPLALNDFTNFFRLKARVISILSSHANEIVPAKYQPMCTTPIEVIAKRTYDLPEAVKTTALMIRSKDNQIIPVVRPGEFSEFAQGSMSIDATVEQILRNASLE